MKKLAKITAFLTLIMLCLCSTAFAGALPDTGQTISYNDTAEIPCPAPGEDFYGQDAPIPAHTPNWTRAETTSPIPQPRGQWCGTM
ncbi:MAG: hypothetical protein DRI57_17145 [Deltaproteobacteria bacterium]|nr:MAG: hypothetical protein DRI57_17145 [Deltaproteobacteria bacterium]